MNPGSPLLAIVQHEAVQRDFYNQLAKLLNCKFANIIQGTPVDAAVAISRSGFCPQFIVIDIGSRGLDILPEIDELAKQCYAGVQVVVIGNENDESLRAELVARGVTKYLIQPITVDEIASLFGAVAIQQQYGGAVSPSSSPSASTENIGISESNGEDRYRAGAAEGKVISLMSAAAGDGATTVAINLAYAISEYGKKVIVVDMDYQFGMIAKNLDLASRYGFRDIVENPNRGIDSTLLKRMVVSYNDRFDVMAAPSSLLFMPDIPSAVMREFVEVLRNKYDYVIIDLPHKWTKWIAEIITSSDHIVMLAQMWLKSVTHASRLMAEWRKLSIGDSKISIVVNRSGSKFKETVNTKDFERVTKHKIDFYLANDVKTVASAENRAVSVFELSGSILASQITFLAEEIMKKLGDEPKINKHQQQKDGGGDNKGKGLFSKYSKGRGSSDPVDNISGKSEKKSWLDKLKDFKLR